MILLCSEIKEVKFQEKKLYVYHLILESKLPQNQSYEAAIFEFASETRFNDIDPGERYIIKRFPFLSNSNKPSPNGKKTKISRIKEEVTK